MPARGELERRYVLELERLDVPRFAWRLRLPPQLGDVHVRSLLVDGPACLELQSVRLGAREGLGRRMTLHQYKHSACRSFGLLERGNVLCVRLGGRAGHVGVILQRWPMSAAERAKSSGKAG